MNGSYFPMRLRLCFKFRNCRVRSSSFINFYNNQSLQIFYWIEVWRALCVVKKSYFFVQVTTFLLLMHCGYTRRTSCVRNKSYCIFTYSAAFFCQPVINCSLSFPEDKKASPNQIRSFSTMPCWNFFFWKIFCGPILLKAM